VISEQVVLGTESGDESETVVKVSLWINSGIVAVVSDSARAQARHVDGITKMQHRVRLPSVTKAEHFLEYGLIGHEAVAA
jgi:hypothetical protein